MCQCLRNVCMVERCVRFFVFERPAGALHADAANRISPGACICIEISIYLSFYLSFDLSICIFLHFKENRAVCPLVALLYVRRYVRSCCLFRMSLGLIFPLAFCLLLQKLVSSALSCLCVFLKLYLCPGWCVAISVLSMLSHAISVLSLCYLSHISSIFLSNLWPLHRLMQKMLPTLKDMHLCLVWQVSVVTEDLLTLLS